MHKDHWYWMGDEDVAERRREAEELEQEEEVNTWEPPRWEWDEDGPLF